MKKGEWRKERLAQNEEEELYEMPAAEAKNVLSDGQNQPTDRRRRLRAPRELTCGYWIELCNSWGSEGGGGQ